jgi:hypothetical protein
METFISVLAPGWESLKNMEVIRSAVLFPYFIKNAQMNESFVGSDKQIAITVLQVFCPFKKQT